MSALPIVFDALPEGSRLLALLDASGCRHEHKRGAGMVVTASRYISHRGLRQGQHERACQAVALELGLSSEDVAALVDAFLTWIEDATRRDGDIYLPADFQAAVAAALRSSVRIELPSDGGAS